MRDAPNKAKQTLTIFGNKYFFCISYISKKQHCGKTDVLPLFLHPQFVLNDFHVCYQDLAPLVANPSRNGFSTYTDTHPLSDIGDPALNLISGFIDKFR